MGMAGTSCLLPPGVAPFWLYAFTVIGLTITTLGSCWLLICVTSLLGCHSVRDNLEFTLSVLYAILFVYSLEACFAVMRSQVPCSTPAAPLPLILIDIHSTPT